MKKQLGKLRDVRFGFGGYQDAQFGLSLTLGGESWGCSDFKGMWANRPDGANWTEDDHVQAFAATMFEVRDILKAAGCQSVDQLNGIPIEAEFDGNTLKSWRVLTEVL